MWLTANRTSGGTCTLVEHGRDSRSRTLSKQASRWVRSSWIPRKRIDLGATESESPVKLEPRLAMARWLKGCEVTQRPNSAESARPRAFSTSGAFMRLKSPSLRWEGRTAA